MSSSASPVVSPVVSPVASPVASPVVSAFASAFASTSTFASQHPEHDAEMQYELRRREMKKIREAHNKRSVSDAYESNRSSRANACDLNGEEFQIVCEELWIDFKSWVNHHDSLRDCIRTALHGIVSKRSVIVAMLVCLMMFRWYVGAGKEACAYSLGYGVFSFVCEVLRHLGEVITTFIMMFIGFCVGLTPIIACICFYEFKDTFPDPDDVDSDIDNEHLKKE